MVIVPGKYRIMAPDIAARTRGRTISLSLPATVQEPTNTGTLVDSDMHGEYYQQVTITDYVTSRGGGGGLGLEETCKCVGGLAIGNRVLVSRPAMNVISDKIGIHV
jgi:hypothetical protein